MRAARCLWRAW